MFNVCEYKSKEKERVNVNVDSFVGKNFGLAKYFTEVNSCEISFHPEGYASYSKHVYLSNID